MSIVLQKIRNQEVFEQPTPSDYVCNKALVAGAAQTLTVPADLGTSTQVPRYALVLGTEDFYYNKNATATIPGSVTDGTSSVLIRKGDSVLLEVAPAENYSLITEASAGCKVQFWFYTRS